MSTTFGKEQTNTHEINVSLPSPFPLQHVLSEVAGRPALVPLVVPLTLFRHYVRKYDKPYLREQTWLNPHPVYLKLHNHV